MLLMRYAGIAVVLDMLPGEDACHLRKLLHNKPDAINSHSRELEQPGPSIHLKVEYLLHHGQARIALPSCYHRTSSPWHSRMAARFRRSILDFSRIQSKRSLGLPVRSSNLKRTPVIVPGLMLDRPCKLQGRSAWRHCINLLMSKFVGPRGLSRNEELARSPAVFLQLHR